MSRDITSGTSQFDSVQVTLRQAGDRFGQGDYSGAVSILEALVESHPSCAPAWVWLGRLALTVPDVQAAIDFFGEAAQLQPDDANTLAWLGDAQRRKGMKKEALASLKRAYELAPDDLVIACKLANGFIDVGRLMAANELLTTTLASFPSVPELYLLRGLTWWQLGNNREAEPDLQLCLVLAPDTASALSTLGDIRREQGRLDEARLLVDRAACISPGDASVLRAQGDLSLAYKDWKKAVYYYDQVLSIVSDDVLVALNRAVALVEMGDALGAIDALESCLSVGASEQWVYEMLGLVFAHRGQWAVAIESLEKAVEREPRNGNAWNVLIVAYNKLGQMEKAEHAAKRALEINPCHVSALVNLGGCYIDLGRHDEGVEAFRRALELDPSNASAYAGVMFGMLFSSRSSASDILAMGQEFDSQVCLDLRKANSFADRDRRPDRVLRVGWLSSDLRAHPVSAFVAPFFRYLDRSQIETYVYDNWPTEDQATATIKPAAGVWRKVRGLGDDALAETIGEDEIDILVDLNGHTAGQRLGVLARKPAPIQVEWLGFPGTSGMSAMDYVLVPNDEYLLKSQWSSEQPWALPNCYGVRGNMMNVPVREGLPFDESGYFTFACMNRYSKISSAALDCFATVLQKTWNSRLLLIGRGGDDAQTLEDLRGRFLAKGVDAERLIILPSLPLNEYYETYNRADVCLDPFPFNGGTTGFDSIWMGVPFVTLRGDALHSRAGSNILKYVELDNLIADSEIGYVEKAVALTHDLAALRRYRNGLRERMEKSPLMDGPGFARGLEDAFRGMWEKWCSREGGVT